jgi:zinc/manganese transport system ATP-binding protein
MLSQSENSFISATLPHYYSGSILALKNIDIKVPIGTLLAIVGPNGGGKSTLLRLLAGLLKTDTFKYIKPSLKTAYLPQSQNLDRTFPLLVEDIVTMGLYPNHKVDKDKVPEILHKVGLSGFEKRALSALSGGQFQRLLFARVIAQNTDFILLDEPFVGVDQATLKDLMILLTQWHEEGKTIITVLHDMVLVKDYFPKCLILSQEVIDYGATLDVLTRENLAKAVFHV